MRNKIFKGLLFLATAAVIVASVLIAVIMYEGSTSTAKRDLRQEATYIKFGLEQNETAYLQSLQNESSRLTRVTLINKSGEVLYDNFAPSANMTNHGSREEVQEAIATGVGTSERMSDTLSEKTFYYAVRLEDGKVLRVARTDASMVAAVVASAPYMIVVVVLVALLAMVLARRITDKMVLPLNEVDLENPLENDTYDELAPFLTRIAQQQRQVNDGLKQLRHKQEELAAITKSMNEGLVILNERHNILSINDSAAKLFGVNGEEALGKNILALERGQELQELLQSIEQCGGGESVQQKDGRVYQLCGSSVGGKGSALLIFDITEKRAAETLRREFSANVSHELKTPLQSILGYAEIMKNGLVQEADKQRFLDTIYSEAGHLIELIDNIMKLSHLDESAGHETGFSEVDLKALAQSTVARLQSRAAKNQVQLLVSGAEAKVLGSPSVLGEIMYNLVDNGIKYNKASGSVKVELSESEHNAIVTISDTGQGIALADQARVFERFYRVDKSHFKKTGGTGLGLSIVKRGVLFHNGKIELVSELEKGTEIKIYLPK